MRSSVFIDQVEFMFYLISLFFVRFYFQVEVLMKCQQLKNEENAETNAKTPKYFWLQRKKIPFVFHLPISDEYKIRQALDKVTALSMFKLFLKLENYQYNFTLYRNGSNCQIITVQKIFYFQNEIAESQLFTLHRFLLLSYIIFN